MTAPGKVGGGRNNQARRQAETCFEIFVLAEEIAGVICLMSPLL
jgi:hypothetical protein